MSSPLSRRQVLDAYVRRRFRIFLDRVFTTLVPDQSSIQDWYLDAMCHALMTVKSGRATRLAITMPPRHLKSICTSVAFPAFVLGLDPRQKFLVASYGAELAEKLHRDFRTVITQPWYQSAFPELKVERATNGEFLTSKGGGRKAVSVGGVTTGFGATYVVVDDLLKASDAHAPLARETALEYYQGSLISRFENQDEGRIIVVAQRLHEDDLPGFCLEAGTFEHLNLPMIAETAQEVATGRETVHVRKVGEVLSPARFSGETIARLRSEMGPSAFAAQYQQNPTPLASDLLDWSKVQFYEDEVARDELAMVVQSWDTAFSANPKADCSVCTTWGWDQDAWLLLDVQRFRADSLGLMERVKLLRKRWRPDHILVEAAGSGVMVLDALRRERRLRLDQSRGSLSCQLVAMTPRADKLTRFAAHVEKLIDGSVFLPAQAPWLADLRGELTAFPGSRYDDQVDSISQFLEWVTVGRQAIRLDRERLHPAAAPTWAHSDGLHQSVGPGAESARRDVRAYINDRLR